MGSRRPSNSPRLDSLLVSSDGIESSMELIPLQPASPVRTHHSPSSSQQLHSQPPSPMQQQPTSGVRFSTTTAEQQTDRARRPSGGEASHQLHHHHGRHHGNGNGNGKGKGRELPHSTSRDSEFGFNFNEDEEDEEEQVFSRRKTLRPVGTTAARRRRSKRESVSKVFKDGGGGGGQGRDPQQKQVLFQMESGHATRISNQLNRNGNMEDATCQTDSLTVLDTLPSERRIERIQGYEIRNELESVMPFQKGNKSLVLERKEVERLTIRPTLKEYRTMTRTESLRTFKIRVGRKAREMAKQERKKLGFFRRILFDLKMLYQRYKNGRRYEWFPLWSDEIKFVEGVFGGAFSSFFSFSRWIWILNLILSILLFFLIIIIGILNTTWSTMKIDFIPFVPFWQGSNDSFFFLGGYPEEALNEYYHMQFAYLLVVFACLLISCATIVESLKRIYLKRAEASANIMLNDYSPFTSVIFTCWDFSLASEEGVRHYRHAVGTALRTLLTKDSIKSKKIAKQDTRDWVKLIIIRTITNAVVLACLGGEAAMIYFFIQSEDLNTVVVGNTAVRITPFIVTGFTIVLPIFFTVISKFEMYTSQLHMITANIARSYLVRLAGVYVLLFGYINSDSNSMYLEESNCWETKLGQEFYQLIWINAVVNVAMGLGLGFVITWGGRLVKKNRDRYFEFDVAQNALDLIYEQCLIWTGMLFCPVISIVSLVFQVTAFYAKFYGLKFYAKYPTELYSAYMMNKSFLMFLFLTLVLSAIPVGYAVTSMKPACGPFKNYEAMYLVIPELVERSPDGLRNFLLFLATPGFLVPLVLGLVISLYYLAATNLKRKKRLEEVESELFSEREDKRYLLRFYNIRL